MNAQTRKLVTKLVRLGAAVQVMAGEQWDGFDIGYGYDYGEFSGPATARAIERESDRLATRFGFSDFETAERVAEVFGLDIDTDHFGRHVYARAQFFGTEVL